MMAYELNNREANIILTSPLSRTAIDEVCPQAIATALRWPEIY